MKMNNCPISKDSQETMMRKRERWWILNSHNPVSQWIFNNIATIIITPYSECIKIWLSFWDLVWLKGREGRPNIPSEGFTIGPYGGESPISNAYCSKDFVYLKVINLKIKTIYRCCIEYRVKFIKSYDVSFVVMTMEG